MEDQQGWHLPLSLERGVTRCPFLKPQMNLEVIVVVVVGGGGKRCIFCFVLFFILFSFCRAI